MIAAMVYGVTYAYVYLSTALTMLGSGGTPPDSAKVSSTLQDWGTVAWVAGAAFCAWGAVLGWSKFSNSTNKRGEGFIQAAAGCLGVIACAGGAGWTMGLIGL